MLNSASFFFDAFKDIIYYSWIFSHPSDSDITYFKTINGIQDSKVARQRLGTSLAGVAVLEGQKPESIITYQVTSFLTTDNTFCHYVSICMLCSSSFTIVIT